MKTEQSLQIKQGNLDSLHLSKLKQPDQHSEHQHPKLKQPLDLNQTSSIDTTTNIKIESNSDRDLASKPKDSGSNTLLSSNSSNVKPSNNDSKYPHRKMLGVFRPPNIFSWGYWLIIPINRLKACHTLQVKSQLVSSALFHRTVSIYRFRCQDPSAVPPNKIFGRDETSAYKVWEFSYPHKITVGSFQTPSAKFFSIILFRTSLFYRVIHIIIYKGPL